MTKTASDPAAAPTLQVGPYTVKSATTYEVSPIKIVITRDHTSSHVPPPEPPPCGCGDKADVGVADIMAILAPYLARFASQGSAPPPPTGSTASDAEPDDSSH